MRWTFWRRSANTLRGRAAPRRTAKSYGPDAPTLASSSREASFFASFLGATVARKPGHRGEREAAVKTIARGMPGVSGVTVVTNARAFYTTRAAAGAPSARHSLLPSWGSTAPSDLQKAGLFSKTRAHRAARSRKHILPSLRGAKRRSNPLFLLRGEMDCFAALAMTVPCRAAL